MGLGSDVVSVEQSGGFGSFVCIDLGNKWARRVRVMTN